MAEKTPQRPYADLKYKARTYIDKDGKEKGVWVQLGTLFSTPHGSYMSIKLDTIPVGDWSGNISVFPREKRDEPLMLDKVHDITDEPIGVDHIPF